MGLKPLGGLSAAIVMLSAYAAAQVAEGDVAAGRRLVQARCSGCHSVEPGKAGVGPNFSGVAQMPSTTSLSLRAFLLTPHPTMPNYRLTPAEIDDIVAFLLSLRRS